MYKVSHSVGILLLCMLLLLPVGCSDPDELTGDARELAEQISPGMTYDEVCTLLGGEGKDIGSGAIIYEWTFKDQGRILAWFNHIDEQMIVSSCRFEQAQSEEAT